MAGDSSPRPRRAIPSTDADDQPEVVDADSPVVITRRMAIIDPDDATHSPTSPIPAPALPQADFVATGRRLSAVSAMDLDDDTESYRPRRSAISAWTPHSADSPTRIGLPDDASSAIVADSDSLEKAASPSQKPSTDLVTGDTSADDGDSSRSTRWWIIVISCLVIVAVAVAIAVFRHTKSSPSSKESVNAATTLDEAALASTTDLSKLGAGTNWRVDQTSGSATDTKLSAACLPATIQDLAPVASVRRTLIGSDPFPAVFHRVEVFDSADTAATVFAKERTQLGSCESTTAYVMSASTILGLADEAYASVIAYQEAEVTYHTVIIARTGDAIATFDVANQTEPIAVDKAAQTLAQPLARRCSIQQGGCPAQIDVRQTPPAASQPAGWLSTNDLPRITLGAGQWVATDPRQVSVAGTQCENLDLTNVGDAEEQQRTFLMSQDANAPSKFGVDEVVLTFQDEAKATQFNADLIANVSSCTQRVPIASVSQPQHLDTVAENQEPLPTTVYTITHTIDQEKIPFRIGVATVGTKVIYLYANPSETYDFSDTQWQQIVARAAQRASQSR